MKKYQREIRIVGLLIFSYLFFQAAGLSPTHYQTFINFGVAFAICLTAWGLIKIHPDGHWRALIAIVVLGGMLRFAWAKLIPTIPFTDFKFYHQSALEFSRGNFSVELPKNYLFPLTLSLGYRVHPAPVTGRLLNALASTITIGLLYLAARQLLGPKPALMSALLFAILPSEINMVSVLGTEIMTTTLLVATSLVFIMGVKEENSWPYYLSSGILFCVGFHFRSSISFYFPVILLIILIFSRSISKKTQAVLYFLAGFIAIQVLIIVGHSLLVGEFTMASLSTQDSFPFLSGTNFEHSGMWNQEDANLYFSWPEEGRDKLARQEAFRRITSHPLSFLRIVISKVSILFRDNTYGNNWSLHYLNWDRWRQYAFLTENYVSKVNGALSQAVYIVIWGFGLVSFRRREIGPASILGLLMVLFTLMPHFIVEVQRRYHHYIMPFIILAASSGLEYSLKEWNFRKWLQI